jgi:hypothetical protein
VNISPYSTTSLYQYSFYLSIFKRTRIAPHKLRSNTHEWKVNRIFNKAHFLELIDLKIMLFLLYYTHWNDKSGFNPFDPIYDSRNRLLSIPVGAFSAPNKRNVFQKALLKIGRGKKLHEKVVERYFERVQKQDREQTVGCFSPLGTTIRDACWVSNKEQLATPEELSNRCMEFLAAHPNTQAKFHYPWIWTVHWSHESLPLYFWSNADAAYFQTDLRLRLVPVGVCKLLWGRDVQWRSLAASSLMDQN